MYDWQTFMIIYPGYANPAYKVKCIKTPLNDSKVAIYLFTWEIILAMNAGFSDEIVTFVFL